MLKILFIPMFRAIHGGHCDIGRGPVTNIFKIISSHLTMMIKPKVIYVKFWSKCIVIKNTIFNHND